MLARSEAVHAALQAALRAREITREYLALVEGRPPARRGTIDAPLGRDRRVRTKISTDTDDPHPAITHFETERALADDTLLRVTLETGRTHQIRAHLLAIGYPVAGDPDYGHAGRHGLRSANSCMPRGLRSITLKPGHRWKCGRHCRRTWSGPSGRRQGNGPTYRCRGTRFGPSEASNAGARRTLS